MEDRKAGEREEGCVATLLSVTAAGNAGRKGV